jgi:hypothetical protein
MSALVLHLSRLSRHGLPDEFQLGPTFPGVKALPCPARDVCRLSNDLGQIEKTAPNGLAVVTLLGFGV